MKLVSYRQGKAEAIGLVHDNRIYALEDLFLDRSPYSALPKDMNSLLNAGSEMLDGLTSTLQRLDFGRMKGVEADQVELMAPVPYPASCRDAYAFRQHVATSRRNRGLDMIPEFDEFPVFYFTNHRAIYGPGDIYCMPAHFNKLDFELEVAIVINKYGKNIPASQADSYIGGFMIMNDLSARALQMQEMKLNLGPAKGKDFATILGPWLVTPDELEHRVVSPHKGHVGKVYDLEMTCQVNGKQVSSGNLRDMHWTFAEIIERASYGVNLYPGDVIGSGTVGTGCFLELNGTARLDNPDFEEQWLNPGDEIEMNVQGLGSLRNRVLKYEA